MFFVQLYTQAENYKAMRYLIIGLIGVLGLGLNPVSGQEETQKIQWMSWEEAVEKSRTEPKKVMLDVYTSWCVWCKRMDSSTLQEPAIVEYINEHYYPVKLNAEYREEITYEDKVYRFVRSGRNGYHELAAELLNGRLSFPTIVFMDENLEIIQSIAGYKTPAQFMRIVTYFGNDRHITTPWSTYKKSFVPKMLMIKNQD